MPTLRGRRCRRLDASGQITAKDYKPIGTRSSSRAPKVCGKTRASGQRQRVPRVKFDQVPVALSKSEIAQGRVIVRTATERPVVATLALLNWKVVDAGNPQAHQAVLLELPILIAV